MISNIPLECNLHDESRVADVIAVSAIVVMEIYLVPELIKMNVRINLEKLSTKLRSKIVC